MIISTEADIRYRRPPSIPRRLAALAGKTASQFFAYVEPTITMAALTIRSPNSVHESIKELAKREREDYEVG